MGTQTYSVTGGTVSENGNAWINVDYMQRNSLQHDDRDYAASANQGPACGYDFRSSSGNPGAIKILPGSENGYESGFYQVPIGSTGTPTAEEIIARLQKLGSHAGLQRQQRDCYYSHPVRDFAETDEALRLRISDSVSRLTYKGPLLDPVAKTRRELEFEIASSKQAASLLEALGFHPVREVLKQRHPFLLTYDSREIEVVIDEVQNLGTFVEVETLIGEDAEESERTAARNCLPVSYTHLTLPTILLV